MRFAKMHGLGNDFVIADLRGAPLGTALPDEAFTRRVCDRHRGIGADGVLTLLDAPTDGSTKAARLVIHNPDGSQPEMCGNGARCAALWIATSACQTPAREEVQLLTDAGLRVCQVEAAQPTLGFVEIGMGKPAIAAPRSFHFGGAEHLAVPVSMGNPHLVFFVDATAEQLTALCHREGPGLCRAHNANIEFVRSLGAQKFSAAVWERGAGPTLACGTGACAVAAAAIDRGLAIADQAITVELPGGSLVLRREASKMQMRGPAELVFRGDI